LVIYHKKLQKFQIDTQTDNLFRLTTLFLRYTYKKLTQKDYTHKKWLGLGSCEGTSSVIESSSHPNIFYIFLCW